MRVIFILLIAIILFSKPVFSQKTDYLPPKFKSLSLEDGLSNLSALSVCQDDLGYIWIATARGLNRFDGISFRQYFFENDTSSLYHDNVSSLHKNHEGKIFCGTAFGVNIYDPQKDKILRVKSQNERFNFFCEHDHNTYGSGNSGGISVYDPVRNEMKKIDGFPQNIVLRSLISDAESGLWGLSENNNILFNYDPAQKVYQKYFLPGKSVSKSGGTIAKLDNYLISCTSNNIHFFDLTKNEFIKVPRQWDRLKNIANNIVNFISEVEEGTLWIGTKENGLYIFNLQSNSYFQFSKSEKHNQLKSNNLTCICKDKNKNLWIGTFDQGVEVAYERIRNFNFDFTLNDFTQNKFITSIAIDPQNVYYIGTRYNGLHVFNPKTKETKILNTQNSFLENNHIKMLCFDSGNHLWVSCEGQLYLYDPAKNRSKQLKIPEPNNGIVCFCESNGLMLAGTGTMGFLTYNLDGQLLGKTTKLGSNITQILKYDQENLIISGYGKGLFLYNPEKDSVQNMKDIVNTHDNNLNEVITMYKDSDKSYWIGNFKYGLYCLKDNRLKAFTTRDGLPSNDITGIVEDENKNLWISTAYGLCQFDKSERFINYFYNEGLGNVQFHQKASAITHDGLILFGGNNGLTFFNPIDLGPERIDAPPIILETLKVSNIEVRPNDQTGILTKRLNDTKKITLNHHFPVFSIDYQGLEYIAAENLKYAYIMEGFEQQWNQVGNRTYANYSNLDPGTYIFKVKAQNNYGLWSDPPAQLEIEIKPAPWNTIWAYSIYLAIFTTILIISFKLILTTNIYKKELEFEQHERIRENEITQMKLRFFTNISHEFRTPLTLIKGNADLLSTELANKNIKSPSISSLQSSTDRLLRLANQILAFRKLENDALDLCICDTNILDATHELVESFQFAAQVKNIEIKVNSRLEQPMVPLDQDKYEKILSNLIGNSLKFSKKNGTILINIEEAEMKKPEGVFTTLDKNVNYIQISVIDNGKGIPKDELPHLFERYMQSKDNKGKPDYSGTGIGLNFTKRLVELHKGHIVASSKENEETCFSVILPKESSAYLPEQISPSNQTKPNSQEIHPNFTGDRIPDNDKKLIVLVEDDLELNRFLKSALSGSHKVISCYNGKEALKLVKNQMPELIISDIMMPEMDGISLCRKIKEDELISHIPVILLTAKAEVENQVTGYLHGADAYITKPFEFEVLKAQIFNLIYQRKNLQEFYKKARLPEIDKKEVNHMELSFMKNINSVIEENYQKPEFNVQLIAEKVNMSRTSFYRKFTNITNMSTKEYLTKYRINKAKEMICQDKYSLGEISYLCGFSSQSTFSLSFKKEVGTTAIQYKQDIQNQGSSKFQQEKT